MSAYSARIIADGASYYWRLGETVGTTAVDVVGGANGTISGGVTLGAAGALRSDTTNAAMTFNGTTGKVVSASNLTLPTAVTIELWMKATGIVGSYLPVFSTRVLSSEAGEILFAATDTHVLVYSTSAQLDSTKNVRDGQWHHIVWVFEQGPPFAKTTAYIDGVLDVSGPFNRTVALTTRPAQIGYESTNAGNYWPGSLDEVAIYPRALTPLEIKAHYDLAFETPADIIGRSGNSTPVGALVYVSASTVYATPAVPVIYDSAVLQRGPTLTGPFTNYMPNTPIELSFIKPTINTSVLAKRVNVFNKSSADYFSPYAQRVFLDGASNYWRLDESSGTLAKDIIGGTNGTISGGVTLNQSGATSDNNKAMTFDGTTGKINVPVGAWGNFGSGSWSVECWLRFLWSGARLWPLDSYQLTAGHGFYLDVFADQTWRFAWTSSIGDQQTNVASVPTAGNGSWHHFVAVINRTAGVAVGYFDGIEVAPLAIAASSVVCTKPLLFGLGYFPYGGALDEVAIYPRALTAPEIAAHYSLGLYRS